MAQVSVLMRKYASLLMDLAAATLARCSTPKAAGNAACFLCSEESSMITGVAVEVDGGRCV